MWPPLPCPSRLPVEGGKAHQNLPDGSDRPLAPLSRDGMPTVLSAPLDCRRIRAESRQRIEEISDFPTDGIRDDRQELDAHCLRIGSALEPTMPITTASTRRPVTRSVFWQRNWRRRSVGRGDAVGLYRTR
jgi:hypothetical protein